MYSCKDFVSLSILSLYEGELLGVVDKLYFDKKLKKLCEIEIIGENGEKFTLLTKNIYKIGKNAIIIKNNQLIKLKEDRNEFSIAPIGSKAYSIKGELIGVVKEIIFNEKYSTQKILLDDGLSLDVEDVATSGKNTLIFYNNTTKISLNKFMPKQPKSLKNKQIQTVKSQPIEKNIENKQIINENLSKDQNGNFLIGRTCTKDIYNFNNELLIKSATIITKKNLKEINKYGKLRELMLFSK